MKKIACCLAMLLLLAGVTAVAASSGAELYASKCARCHGDDGTKTAATGGVVIKGLSAGDALSKMNGYLDGSYGGDKARLMTGLLKRFNEEEIKGLADYIGTL